LRKNGLDLPLIAFSILLLVPVGAQDAFAGTEPNLCDLTNLGYMSDSNIMYCLYGIGEPPIITSNNVNSASSSLVESTNSIPGAALLGNTGSVGGTMHKNIGGVYDHLTGIGTAITPNPLEIQPPELTPPIGPFEANPEFANSVSVNDIECTNDGSKCFYGTNILDRGPVTGFDFATGGACIVTSTFCQYFSVMDDSINTLTPFTLVKAGNVITGINPQTPRILNIPSGFTQPPVYTTVDAFGTFTCGQPDCRTGLFWYDGFEYADNGVLYGAFNQVITGDGFSTFRSTLVSIPTGGVGNITPIPIGSAFASSTRGYAFDSINDIMYAVGGGSNFYTVNLNNGQRTASLNADFGGSLQFGPDGRLYSNDSFVFPNGLAVVDPSDGMITSLPNPTSFDDHTSGLTHVSPTLNAVGGEFLGVDSTALLVAGVQMNAAWMIPVIVSAIGIGIVIARKF